MTRLVSEPPDLNIIADPVSWTTVKQNAGRHGVAPLVAFIARPHLSPAERAWCDRVLMSSWNKHEQSLEHLEHVLSILGAAGIPALALKGPILARRYYQPAFLRKASVDLDLAVKKADLERACEALAHIGYVPEPGIRETKATSHHIALLHASRPTLELHFRLSHKALGIPVSEFLDRAVPYPLPKGGEARILSPADEILHLVLHRASGRFATLFHLYEVRRIWAAAPLHVRKEAIRIAALHHFTGVFAMTDIAFRARWGEPMLTPDMSLEPTWLHWRLTGSLYDEFERCSDPGRELPLAIRLRRKWLDLQMTDHPADALRFTADMARIAWFQLFRKGWRTVKVGNQ
ncbi:MAG: nucleotidyltransferase family protein [Bryobacteraceae bacterium]